MTGELAREWSGLVSTKFEAHIFSVPQCYLHRVDEDVLTYTLCGFSDASLTAYAAVIYLAVETASRITTRFVVAKTRISPLKKQSIPRLELFAALLLVRLMDTVSKALRNEVTLSSPRLTRCTLLKSWRPFVQEAFTDSVLEPYRLEEQLLLSSSPTSPGVRDLQS